MFPFRLERENDCLGVRATDGVLVIDGVLTADGVFDAEGLRILKSLKTSV